MEDDPSVCLWLSSLLLRHGFKVVSAPDARQGLKLVAEQEVDVALLDLSMPGGGGFLVAESLRKTPATAHIPIIFLTADGSPATRLRAVELGASEFLKKPFEGESVLQSVCRCTIPGENLNTLPNA